MSSLVVFALEAFFIILAVQAILSWFPHEGDHVVGRVHAGLCRVTHPVMRHAKRVLPPVRVPRTKLVIDFATLVVMLVIELVAIPLAANL